MLSFLRLILVSRAKASENAGKTRKSQGVFVKVKGAASGLVVVRSGRDIVLTNGLIEIRLVYRDGGYSQEFFGIDRQQSPRMLLSTIHRNLVPLTEHRLTADPLILSHRRHMFEVNRESLRMVYSNAEVTESDSEISVQLTGSTNGDTITSTITLNRDSKFVPVTVRADFGESRRAPLLEYLMSAYAFLPDGNELDRYSKPSYAWAPSLRPEDDHVIAERSFHSPAVVVQLKKLLAAIIPDPDNRSSHPMALDLDLSNGLIWAPMLSCGYCKSESDGFFAYHDRSLLLRPAERSLSYGFALYLDADAASTAGFQPIQEFIWDKTRLKRRAQAAAHASAADDDQPSLFSNDLNTKQPLTKLFEAVCGQPYPKDPAKAVKIVAGLISKQRYRDEKTPAIKDAHTMIPCQSADAMRRIADLILMIYRESNDPKHLKLGIEALSQMLWLQETWNGQIGVFAAGNSHESYISQAEFGRTLIEYYEVTQKPHYMERGLAAMRAGLALGQPDAPSIRAWAVRRYGAALIDTRSRKVFVLGPCSVDSLSFKPGSIDLNIRNGLITKEDRPLLVKFRGLRGDSYKVSINGEGKRYPKVELESGIIIGNRQ